MWSVRTPKSPIQNPSYFHGHGQTGRSQRSGELLCLSLDEDKSHKIVQLQATALYTLECRFTFKKFCSLDYFDTENTLPSLTGRPVYKKETTYPPVV